MPNQFTDIAHKAAQLTETELATEISNLTSLTNADVTALITDSGISKEDLAAVLEKVHDATASNNKKAESIKGISKGVEALVSIAEKVLKYL